MRVFLLLLGAALALGQDDLQRDLARAKAQERQLLMELQELDQELMGIELELDQLQAKADQLEQERRLREDELTAAELALEAEGGRLQSRLQLLYRLNRRGFARALFSAEDPSDLRRRTRYIAAILRESRLFVRRFVQQVNLRTEALQRVETSRSALLAVQGQVRLKESTLRDDRARRMAFLNELRSQKDLALRALAEKARAGADFSRQLDAREGALDVVSSESAGRAFQRQGGRLPWPVEGGVLDRNFGFYIDDRTGQQEKNNGVDLRAEQYMPIHAVAEGVVVHSGYIAGMGQTVVLEHGPYTTVYAHANKLYVAQGQRVTARQVIGLVGETGLTDGRGPRLHFEVRYHNTPQPPLNWLRPR